MTDDRLANLVDQAVHAHFVAKGVGHVSAAEAVAETIRAAVAADPTIVGMEPYTDRTDQLVVDRGSFRPEYRSGKETIDPKRFIVVYVPGGQSNPPRSIR